MKIEVIGGYGGESLGCRMTCLLISVPVFGLFVGLLYVLSRKLSG